MELATATEVGDMANAESKIYDCIESLLKKEIAYARQDQDCLNMEGNIEAQDKAYILGKKEQREKYYYEIENSTGTKEADYIDKQVNGGS